MLIVVVAAAGAAAATLASSTSASPERADCPGTIVCPLTGELVCRDRCPRIDAGRPDCPGRIECPVDGELICKDRCPAGASVAEELPPCCSADN